MTDLQKQRFKEYLELGASLYIPASRCDLIDCVHKSEIKNLRSIIICLEDAVLEEERYEALDRLARLLKQGLPETKVFVRPKNPSLLAQILKLEGVQQLEGFVLPKIGLGTISQYIDLLKDYSEFRLMPTLETVAAFQSSELEKLKLALEPIKTSILCMRIGANDLFALLGIKRMPSQIIYESPLRMVIDQVVLCFRSEGYPIVAAVFDFIKDFSTLERELEQDVNYGLFSKTAIHPRQIPLIESHYQVSQSELEQAQAILSKEAQAVFQFNGQMCEPCIHQAWAEQVLDRAEIYGLKSTYQTHHLNE